MKFTTISALSIASLALLFSACSGSSSAPNTAADNTAAAAADKSNAAAIVVNSNQTAVNNAAPVSNAANAANAANAGKPAAKASPAKAGNPNAEKMQGQLHAGKTGSYILYVGRETGDYAAFCFGNESEAGRAILAACKDGDQCEFVGEVAEDAGCKAPGLEADLSARGKIVKVESVKTLGRRK